MYQYEVLWVNQATKTGMSKRITLLNWIIKQPESLLVEALSLMLKNAKANKVAKGMLKEHIFSSLIEALKSMHNVETKRGLERGINSDQGRKVTDIRIARIIAARSKVKQSAKFDIIKNRINDIKRMRNKDLSWREISHYLKKYHKVNISHSYLQRAYNKIVNGIA